MTVQEIERVGAPEISRADAQRAFLEYRRAVLQEPDAQRKGEYEALMRGYKAIAAGAQVIDLQQTMHAAGVQEDTLYPRLAICRADARRCRVSMNGDGAAIFADERVTWRQRAAHHRVAMPAGTFPAYAVRWEKPLWVRSRPDGFIERRGWREEALALVPIVPPALHPRAALWNYHVVWDAVWTPAPPVDPLLVRHLAGHLYAIVAQWDLTPLERAVLRGRL